MMTNEELEAIKRRAHPGHPEFIACARRDVSRLVEEVERLRRERENDRAAMKVAEEALGFYGIGRVARAALGARLEEK